MYSSFRISKSSGDLAPRAEQHARSRPPRRGSYADRMRCLVRISIETTQPTTPPSCCTRSRASSFSHPPLPCLSCISQDLLSPPMAAGLPSFVRIGLRLLLMLRLGMARVAHLFCRTLGGPATLFRTGPPPCFRTGQAHSTVFHSRYPGRLDCRVSCASGHVYCPCSGSASRQRHLVLLDLAAGLQRPRRPGFSILNFRRQLFRVGRDLADS